MDIQHPFLLTPSSWLGEGKIQLNMVEEELAFFTRWNVAHSNGSLQIECIQEIQVKGLTDIMINHFLFYDITSTAFLIDLENQALGKVVGKGVISSNVIGWEFRAPEMGFEGFEFYERQIDGSYLMRAEYATSDQFRTLIKGKVWQSSLNDKKDKQ